MRIDAQESSSFYWLRWIDGPVAIFLDDVEVRHVIEADEEAGRVVQYVADEVGSCIVDDGGDVVRRELFGRVEIRGTRRSQRAF